MAPSPQENVSGVCEKPDADKMLTGQEVVISGMSGIFPNSDSVKEFEENLYNKVDMVSSVESRWNFNHPEVPVHLGKVNTMGKFDAQFFRVHFKQACTMEPMSRKLLEHAYSAIFDSGINPLQLRGKKVGVFIGSTFSESEKIVIYENIQRNGFGITGCNKAMYANRISYWIDGKGPSYALDLACASSMACLEHAYRSITDGQCEAAIVGGCNLCMHPRVSLNLRRAGFLCLDGKTKCFDKRGDGYVRSDAMSVLFLQKAKDAKRIYSQVYHAKGNYSLRPDQEFMPEREPEHIKQFLEAFYSEIDVKPSEVEYVEASGVAIAKADGNELQAIGQVFGKEKPVKVGSVKSNMGNAEPASGACSLTKACLAFENGKLPANLHYEQPQDHIAEVKDGKVQVLQDHTLFSRGYVALNSFSYTGADIHVLLKGHYKQKDLNRYKSSIPYLVLASGRLETCVKKILDEVKDHPLDPEEIGLLHNIHEYEIPGHMVRGYTVLQSDENNNKPTMLTQHNEYFDGMTRPIWFVYSGMGSQWAGMGAALMRIPIFAAAIEKCRQVLEPRGVDIVEILTKPDKTIYDNILNSFVGIAAVQIGLTDVLKALGIEPDNIIGHSVGELGCAYADGCFTAEEMILAAYSRGLVSIQTPFIKGSMAAVGLGYKAVLPLCPPEIEVACHNSSESSTISGPADIMKTFVSELTSKGVFAKEVPCSNIAYHSRYIAGAGDGLRKYLSDVIKEPKARSERWVSTSVPQDKWDDPVAKYSSAEYHTNNLLNSVLFEETSKLIPSDAICIEIAPHGLLQAILKRAFSDCIHVPLTRRGHADPVKFFLESIGKLYEVGLNPKVDALYPRIEYPVSTGTPLLSHLVQWEHSEDWPQARFNTKDRVTAAVREFIMSLHDDDFQYFQGYTRNGVKVFPEAAILVLLWETLAMQRGEQYQNISVAFTNVQFKGEVYIPSDVPLRLNLMIHKGNNKFEVSYNNIEVACGYITEIKTEVLDLKQIEEQPMEDHDITLNAHDFYKMMHQKGYAFNEKFKSVTNADSSMKSAEINWNDDWITFLDSLMQINTQANNYYGVSVPAQIRKIYINVAEQNKTKETLEEPYFKAKLSDVLEVTRCGGVYFEGMKFHNLPKIEKNPDVLKSREFVPHFLTGDVNLETALHIILQIISDNVSEEEVKVTQFLNTLPKHICDKIRQVAEKLPFASFDITTLKTSAAPDMETKVNLSHAFIVDNVLGDEKKMQNLSNILTNDTFVISWEKYTTKIEPKYKQMSVIAALTTEKYIVVVLKKANGLKNDNFIYIPIDQEQKFGWVDRVERELMKTRRVVLVSERQPYCGLLGYVRNLRKIHKNKISLILIDDFHAPSFKPESHIFQEQMQKNLAYNILKKGQWGSEYFLPSTMTSIIPNVVLTSTVPGDLDSLTWVEAPTHTGNHVVQVCFAGPSYRDTQKAARVYPNEDNSFGMDFSGVNKNGERVMGVVKSGAIGSTIEADPNLLWPVPSHWTLEDAATVPLPYVLAYYCLAIKTSLRENQKVFVHGGAGALGQAVISLCLATKCNVFTTVSDIHKKRFLMRLFPDLKENQIGNSRDPAFQTTVFNGNGKDDLCNIVISCARGERREATMFLTAFRGIFLDLDNVDMQENKDFGMYFLTEERSYIAVDLTNIFRADNGDERKRLQTYLAEGITRGIVRPLTRTVFSPSEVSRAFRFLASTRHRGRVVLKIQDPNSKLGFAVTPRLICPQKSCYVIVCDGSDIGIELSERLVKRGARNLMIHVRGRSVGGYFCTKIISWQNAGVTVRLSSENLQSENGCRNLLNEASKLGTIDGIFIAQVHDDGESSETVTQQDIVTQFAQSSLIVANLDACSRNICTDLRYFVVMSKLSTEDTKAAFTNSTSEKICAFRNDFGLPALYFHVGIIDEYNQNLDSFDPKQRPLTYREVLIALEASLKLKYHNTAAFNTKIKETSGFVKKITKILGANNLDNFPETLTLSELRFNEINIDEIKTEIEKAFNVFYHSNNIANMTIGELKHLDETILNSNTKFSSGLGAFFTYIEEDECMAAEPMVAMPTKLSNATENEEELDTKGKYLMLIPGFEGHHAMFTPVCERLKIQAMLFQLNPDMANENIQEMASTIMKFMKKRFELKSKFYLMGYSFGVNVALELAALLEKEGHVGVVFCLDSSPDALRVQLDAYLGNLTDDQLQNSIIEHMYRLMAGQGNQLLSQDLTKAYTWNEKIEACVNRLRDQVHYSHQYKRTLLDAAYRRILLARTYKPKLKLESEIVLMKGIPHPNASKLPEDYNLSAYSKHPVRVFNLDSDHAMAPRDGRVSNYMNRMLDPSILEEFKKKNLCETYLADPFKVL